MPDAQQQHHQQHIGSGVIVDSQILLDDEWTCDTLPHSDLHQSEDEDGDFLVTGRKELGQSPPKHLRFYL